MPIEHFKNPKGELLSPITQAIVQHLQTNGPSDSMAINQALLRIDGYRDDSGPEALRSRLRKLCAQDHIHRVIQGDKLLYMAGADPQAAYLDGVHTNEAVIPAALTPPPRHNVMQGHYAPSWTVARAGALDYAKHPSLHMGQRREFRSEVV
ncbi:hypothetical protein SAMN05192589_107142 [Paracidovorax valerianellae]|uniref:Uncharacterized protein n=1 Tax=Paracidovorax valerianellae TaxID=187868 RepID=A0A1G6VUI1_9BURK|nr:hypothetical protein [Paracidovorax valerianellae]SDD57221.1 hypothetical protein SAMN05192589_107142 [Paracidovorax valerianellae]